MCMKLARMTTIAWSLKREPHQQKGKDRASGKMPGRTAMTAPVPVLVEETSPSNLHGAGCVPQQGEECNSRQTKDQGGE